jgi:predicted phage tail protein
MQPELVQVRLYGHLAKRFGRMFELAVATPAEAVRALCTLLPGFEQHVRHEHSEPGYHVLVGKESRGLESLKLTVGQARVIRIIPAVAGAKRAGVLQVIVGAALIVAGVVATAYGMPQLGAFLISTGTSMVIGGVIQMLSPQRLATPPNEEEKRRPSYQFDSIVNTVGPGHPVPVLFGRAIVGGAVYSSGLSVADVIIPGPPPAAPPPATLPGEQPLDPTTYESMFQGN